MTAGLYALTLVTLAGAGLLQRVTGIGYALTATPVLLAAVGPAETVRLVSVTGIVTCSLTLAATWRDCRPRELAVLVPFSLAAMWPAGHAVQTLGEDASSLLAGTVVLLALWLSLRPQRFEAVPVWAQGAVAGTLSGAMNVITAIGGPMGAAYGISRRWRDALVPNLQVLLLVGAVGVLLVRGWPTATDTRQLAVLIVAAGVGVLVGHPLSRRMSTQWGIALTAVVAVLGASIALLDGLLGLVA